MEPTFHHFNELFQQLGLPDDEASMRAFISQHHPLPEQVKLAEAKFWTPAQADFLRREIAKDADWAEVVDRLDASLRS